MENSRDVARVFRVAGFAAVAAALTMIAGAVAWALSGADLDGALLSGELRAYLTQVAMHPILVKLNLALWLVGVFLLGVAGTLFAALPGQSRTQAMLARYCYWIAVPLAMMAFVVLLANALVVPTFAAEHRILFANVLGWIGSRADWVATALVVGLGPGLLSYAGRGVWIPTWLVVWGGAATLAGTLTVVALLTEGLTTFGFLVVPVGLGWTLAAGIVALLRANQT